MRVGRLKTLYGVMSGLPAEAVRMTTWRSRKKRSVYGTTTLGDVTDERLLRDAGHTCGTTACLLGWAAAFPKFKAAGLYFSESTNSIRFNGSYDYSAGAKFFNITRDQATTLFSPSRHSDEDGFSEKRKALHRVRKLLFEHGHITPERNAELAEQEAGLWDSLRPTDGLHRLQWPVVGAPSAIQASQAPASLRPCLRCGPG